MTFALLVYFITMLDGIHKFLFGVILGDIICLVVWIFTPIFSEKYEWEITPLFKWSLTLIIIGSVLNVIIPSEKDAYLIAGAYVAENIVTSETTKNVANKVLNNTSEISDKVVTIINQKLDDYIAENNKLTENKK